MVEQAIRADILCWWCEQAIRAADMLCSLRKWKVKAGGVSKLHVQMLSFGEMESKRCWCEQSYS
jgi:hypothetical protein